MIVSPIEERLTELARQAFSKRNFTHRHLQPIEEGLMLVAGQPDLEHWRARFLVEQSNYLRRAPSASAEEALEPASEALEIARTYGDPVLFGLAARQFTLALRTRDSQSDRCALLAEAMTMLRGAIDTQYSKVFDLGPKTVLAQVGHRLSGILADQSRHTDALEIVSGCLETPGLASASPYWCSELLRRKSSLLRSLGSLEEHQEFLDQLDRVTADLGPPGQVLLHRLRGEEHERRQEFARSRAEYQLALLSVPPGTLPVKRGNLANSLALVSLRLGELGSAGEALNIAEECWHTYGRATTGEAISRRHRARIAAAQQRWPDAIRQLLMSIETLRRAGSETYGVTATVLVETLAQAAGAGYDLAVHSGDELATPDGRRRLDRFDIAFVEAQRTLKPNEHGTRSRLHRSAARLALRGWLTGEEPLSHAERAYEAALKAKVPAIHLALSAGVAAEATEALGRDAVDWSRTAIDHLESLRATISDEFDRARVANESRSTYLRAWRAAAAADDAELAIRVAEAARGTMIISLLTEMARDDEGAGTRSFGRALSRLRRLESAVGSEPRLIDQEEAEDEEDVDGEPGDNDERETTRSRNLAAEQAHVLNDLRGVSEALENLLMPRPMSSGDARRIAGRGWVLYLDCDETFVYSTVVGPHSPGVWVSAPMAISPDARSLIRRFGDAAVSPIIASGSASAFPELGELSEAFFPPVLMRALEMSCDSDLNLTIVPAGDLYAFPFSACPVGTRRLVHSASLVMAPSLRLVEALADRPAHRPSRPPLMYADRTLPGSDHEIQAMLERAGAVLIAQSATELREALVAGHEHDFASLSVHGELADGGFHQHLRLDAHESLSVADCLELRFPSLTVAGACWIARMSHVHGADPIGLPVACLLRGARHFVGGLFPIQDDSTGRILAEAYKTLMQGASFPQALARAQAQFLDNDPSASLRSWSGLVVIGSP